MISCYTADCCTPLTTITLAQIGQNSQPSFPPLVSCFARGESPKGEREVGVYAGYAPDGRARRILGSQSWFGLTTSLLAQIERRCTFSDCEPERVCAASCFPSRFRAPVAVIQPFPLTGAPTIGFAQVSSLSAQPVFHRSRLVLSQSIDAVSPERPSKLVLVHQVSASSSAPDWCCDLCKKRKNSGKRSFFALFCSPDLQAAVSVA